MDGSRFVHALSALFILFLYFLSLYQWSEHNINLAPLVGQNEKMEEKKQKTKKNS